MPHPLDTFFAPDSIALIGASRDPGENSGAAVVDLRKNGFPGKIFPINPNYGDIDGLKCFPSITEIGQRSTLRSSLFRRARARRAEQCAAVGVKNAVIISSGFAEEGGDSAAMQDAIVALAKKSGMRISGPNAEGSTAKPRRRRHLQPDRRRQARRARLMATTAGSVSSRKPAASASRSASRQSDRHRGQLFVSAGNESDLGAGEFLDYMVQDASTDVILLFIEGIRDVDQFLAAARRAAETGKPVIVTKVGRSDAGERAAASHTASMAGWSTAYDAVFAKYGFIVSNDLDEAVTIAAVLTTNPLPRATASPCSRCPAAPASGARTGFPGRACRCRNCRRRSRPK